MLHAVALVPVSGGAREGDRQREVWRGRERGEGDGGVDGREGLVGGGGGGGTEGGIR